MPEFEYTPYFRLTSAHFLHEADNNNNRSTRAAGTQPFIELCGYFSETGVRGRALYFCGDWRWLTSGKDSAELFETAARCMTL